MPNPFTGSMTNADGYALLIPSQLVGSMVAAPFAVCFTDANGNEYSVTGNSVSSELAAPIPVVLCNSAGLAVTPPMTITSNSNTITISSSLSGKRLGAPTAVVLCDVNGNPVTLTGAMTGSFVRNPASCVLCDTTGKSLTATYSANVIIAGSLLEWRFEEQSGGFTSNLSSPSTSNNLFNDGQSILQNSLLWFANAGSITVTDNFAAGPNNSNLSASRWQSGAGSAALKTSGSLSIPSGNCTMSCWMKLNTGTSATITPQFVGSGATTSWSVTNAWQRFTFTNNNGVATTGIQIFEPASTDLLTYGLQVEHAASASSYVAPTFNLNFGSGGTGGTDFPTWSGNGTVTLTNSKRTVGVNDTDTTITTGTWYVALKSSTATPQNYGVVVQTPNPLGTGVPAAFEFQSSWWNGPANTPTSAGGSRNYDPFMGSGGSSGLSKIWPTTNLYDQQWHICALTYDGTDMHLYVDGLLKDSPVASPVSGTAKTFLFDLFCLGNPGSGVSLNFPGLIAYVSAYANSVHTLSQIKQNTSAIANKMITDGLTNVLGVQGGILVTEGDSITDGTGNAAWVGHPQLLAWNYSSSTPFQVINYGHSGDQVAQLTSRAAQLDALIDSSKSFNILVVLIGRNDLDHVSSGTFETNLQTYCQARQASGWKVVVCTLLPTTGATAGPLISGVNSWIRSNYTTFADALADLGNDATILANYTSTTYLWDGTHPTSLVYNLMVPYIITAINGLGSHPAQPSNPAPGTPSPSPATGTHTGGTTVTLTGTGFLPGVKVTFGGAYATITNTSGNPNVTSTSITCTTPAGSVGAVDVVVKNIDGQSATATGAYTYS